MKVLQIFILSLAVMGTVSLFSACHGHDHSHSKNGKDKSGPEYTSQYVCPMHCKGSGSDEAGKCPVCKMDYVLNKDFEDQNANADHEHDGDADHEHNGEDHDHDHDNGGNVHD